MSSPASVVSGALGKMFIEVQHYGPARNILLGGGFAYAIAEEKYLHLPAALFFPSIYAGYQAYKQRERIAGYARSLQSPVVVPEGPKSAGPLNV